MTRAIILAAGLSSRIGALTSEKPKCLLDLRGESILTRQLRLLSDCGISDTWIITGHGANALLSAAGDGANFRYYPDFARTNNLYTLASCADLLTGDTLIVFADVLAARDPLQRCISSTEEVTLLIDRNTVRAGTMRINVAGNTIQDIGSHIDTEDGDGNFIGIAKLSFSSIAPFRANLERCASDPELIGAYYTEVFRCLASAGFHLTFIDMAGGDWFEIDTPDDYREAQAHDFYLDD